MNTLHTTRQDSLLGLGGLLVASALLSFSALAATPTVSAQAAEINAKFEQDKASCLSSKTGAERTVCLKEASKARNSARNAPIYDDATYRHNKFDRCRVLSGDEARDCFARMKGEGTTSGSVEGGGIYREKVTIEVGGPCPRRPRPRPDARGAGPQGLWHTAPLRFDGLRGPAPWTRFFCRSPPN